ncbi:hypothetical protein [Microcoleus sp. bin38.metabat.b11b12b14.051]|uniref:hypothetical protein n=1 Tax=Microcoleus sp. bin38.metabat.b11b12b14.051 TaxID=2742709 RepID=UPI00260053F2|nr:hypothetical protein [Microcoleus sp. bin38.metabat.b11b12b14.051]
MNKQKFSCDAVNLGLEGDAKIFGGWRRASHSKYPFWAGVTTWGNLNCSAKGESLSRFYAIIEH